MRRAVVVALLLTGLTGCRYGGNLDDVAKEAAAPPVRVVVDPSAAPPDVHTYLKVRGSPAGGSSVTGGIRVDGLEDLARLRGAPTDFKTFIGWQLTGNRAEVMDEMAAHHHTTLPPRCEFAARLNVWGVAPRVAMGREWWCNRDANEVIWIKDHETWHRAARMRGGWNCSTLDRYKVPADITAAVCWEEDERTIRRYTGPS